MKKLFIFMILSFAMITAAYNQSLGQGDSAKPLVPKHKSYDDKLFFSPQQVIERAKIKDHMPANRTNYMPSQIITEENESVVSGDENPESEFHAIMSPIDSNVILVSPMRQNPGDYTNPLKCPVYYTHDFGKTWTASTFNNVHTITNGYPAGGGDPMFAFDANGKAYLSWISLVMTLNGYTPDSMFAIMYWASSTDAGATWQRESNDRLAYSAGKFGMGGILGLKSMHDKEWMSCDLSNSNHKNDVYAAMALLSYDDNNNELSSIILRKKPAGSPVFNSDSVRVNSINFGMTQFTALDVDNSGNVHVCFFGYNGTSSFWHSISTDAGNTFQPETHISDFVMTGATMIPNSESGDSIAGITKARLMPSPQMAIDRSDKATSGNIYFIWTASGIASQLSNANDIYFSRSIDNGATWSQPIIINNDPKGIKRDQFYPSIAVNPDGVVVVGWYDRRDDPNNLQTDYYVGVSYDGGLTFTNTRVSSQATDFGTIGQMNNGFGIGEYTQLLATKGYAVPIWTDGRSGDGDLNIYSAFLPLGGKTGIVERIEQVNAAVALSEPFPNPAIDHVSFKLNCQNLTKGKFVITDLDGKALMTLMDKQFEAGPSDLDIDLGPLPSGEYNLLFTSDYGYVMKKIEVVK